MLQSLRDTGAKLNILVLDACRNNPLLATSRSSGSTGAKAGLAAMRPPQGALVAFATEPGRLASDGKEAGNGLYTRHLARWIKEPNLTIEQVFKRTREAVQTESKGEQVPTEYSVLTGADLYLVTAAVTAVAAVPVVPPATAATTTVSTNVYKNNPQQTSRSAVSTLPVAIPSSLSNAAADALDAISSGEVARRHTESTAPAKAMVAMIDTAQARVKLSQVGGSFTKQSLQQAIDNDDVIVFDLLITSGWKLETWDVVRIIDPRENRWDWPIKIMNSMALNGKAMPMYTDVCDAKYLNDRFKGLADVLRRGFDSPALEVTRILYHRETFNKLVAERRKYYQQLCGATALALK